MGLEFWIAVFIGLWISQVLAWFSEREERKAWEGLYKAQAEDFAKVWRERNAAIGKVDAARCLLQWDEEDE